MDNNKRIKILTYLVLFLIALNIGLIVSVVLIQNKINSRPYGFYRHHRYYSERVRHRFIDYMSEELQLTSSQRQYFENRIKQYRETAHSLIDSLRNYRQLLNQQLFSQNPDTQLIIDYAEKIGHFHSQLTLNQSYLILDLLKQCNPNQRQKLKEIFYRRPRFRR